MKYSTMPLFLLYLLDIVVAQNGVCEEDTSVLLRNLSLGRPSSQSSLYDGSFDNGIQGFAWRANDGNKNSNYRSGSCTHVAVILDNHWWQVNLQNSYSVVSVTIMNRDKFAFRLHDFGIEVSLSDQDDGNGHLMEATPCHYHAGAGIGNSEERTFPCTAGAVGQHVRIYKSSDTNIQDILTLCEVEVSGYRMKCDLLSSSSSTIKDLTTSPPLVTTEVASTSSTIKDLTTSSPLITTEVASTSSTIKDLTTTSPLITTEVASTSSTIKDLTTSPPLVTTDVASTSSTIKDLTTTSPLITTEVASTSSTIKDLTTSPPLITTEVASTSSSNTIDETTTSFTNTPTYLTSCNCHCRNKTVPTMSELVERVEQMKKQLTVNKQMTNSYRRKLISAPDSRMSAKSIGVVLGAGVLVFVFGSIVAMDLPRLKQFLTSVCRK